MTSALLFGVPRVRVVGDAGVERKVGRLERRRGRKSDAVPGAAVSTPPEPLSGPEFVGAAFGTHDAVLRELVGHGVGKGLHGVGAGDRVAVEVQQRMELVEAQATMVPEQGQARGAERPAAQRNGVDLERREGWLVVAGWAPAVTPLGPGPEAVAECAELVEYLEAAGCQGFEALIDTAELVEQLVALDLEVESDGAVQTCGVAHGELAAGAQVGGCVAVGRHRKVLVPGR